MRVTHRLISKLDVVFHLVPLDVAILDHDAVLLGGDGIGELHVKCVPGRREYRVQGHQGDEQHR